MYFLSFISFNIYINILYLSFMSTIKIILYFYFFYLQATIKYLLLYTFFWLLFNSLNFSINKSIIIFLFL